MVSRAQFPYQITICDVSKGRTNDCLDRSGSAGVASPGARARWEGWREGEGWAEEEVGGVKIWVMREEEGRVRNREDLKEERRGAGQAFCSC